MVGKQFFKLVDLPQETYQKFLSFIVKGELDETLPLRQKLLARWTKAESGGISKNHSKDGVFWCTGNLS
jgi:hypothetical protein